MSIRKVGLMLFLFFVVVMLMQQILNGKEKVKFVRTYCDCEFQEEIDLSLNGFIYDYHHYFTDKVGRVIFNQDVSGVFLRLGNYHLMHPLKENCYSGCDSGISIPESSLFNVLYKQALNDSLNSTLLFLPERGIAVINEHKQSLSSLLMNEDGR